MQKKKEVLGWTLENTAKWIEKECEQIGLEVFWIQNSLKLETKCICSQLKLFNRVVETGETDREDLVQDSTFCIVVGGSHKSFEGLTGVYSV